MAPEILPTPIEGLVLLHPRVFEDIRGNFAETFSKRDWAAKGMEMDFVQDNQSMSKKNTLRGLHFQAPPSAQAKLIRVAAGSILDVVVDIRKSSKTYGQSYKVLLSDENYLQLFVPVGFAHGFLALEDETIVTYKCSEYYNPDTEGGILWNDPALSIDWGINEPFLSEKDRSYAPFSKFKSPF